MQSFVVYRRCSTAEQSERGNGLAAQMDACCAYVTRNGGELVGTFTDEGVSGGSSLDKRHALLEAISQLQKGYILLVSKRDRLCRDPLIMAMIEAAVARKHARIISTSGEGTQDDDPSSVLMRRIVDAFSEYERLIIRSRTVTALRAKKNRGERTGHIPFGFKLGNDGKHLATDEQEQRILQEIKALKTNGLSLRKIAQELNNRGITNRGHGWNPMSAKRVGKL